MSFNTIHEYKILAKNLEFTVVSITPDMWKSKTLILLTNLDQKSLETVSSDFLSTFDDC